MLDINGQELLIILLVAVLVIGPERLPEYVATLRRWIRQLRDLAVSARSQLREQMGPEFDNVDWKAYDPRQYDPRRIVREALLEEPASADLTPNGGGARRTEPTSRASTPVVFDPQRVTPYDADAT